MIKKVLLLGKEDNLLAIGDIGPGEEFLYNDTIEVAVNEHGVVLRLKNDYETNPEMDIYVENGEGELFFNVPENEQQRLENENDEGGDSTACDTK